LKQVTVGHNRINQPPLRAKEITSLSNVGRRHLKTGLAQGPTKEGSVERVDLTLLSIDQQKLPIYLQMRRLSLCDNQPWPGEPVIVAIPEGTGRSHVMLPALLPANLQKRFSTVISDVATTGNSGSGMFDAGQKCLLGIISLKTQTPKTSKKTSLNILCLHRLFGPSYQPITAFNPHSPDSVLNFGATFAVQI
jgi:hypothetical protein